MDKANYLDGNRLLTDGKTKLTLNTKYECVLQKIGKINCPNCNFNLIGYGFERRQIQGRGDKMQIILSQRLYCKNCHKIFHIYPKTLLLPKLRYSPEYYNFVIETDSINRECEACDSTQNRWRHNARQCKETKKKSKTENQNQETKT